LTANTIAAIQADRIQPSRIVVEDDDPLREEMLTARRCHGCGALVFHWPCLACQLAAGGPTTKSQRLTLDQSLEKLRRARTAQRGRQSAPDRRAA
jgi:hypothetical protein